MSEGKETNGVVHAGPQNQCIEVMVENLLQAAVDKQEEVREAICQAVKRIGHRQTGLVLHMVKKLMDENSKLAVQQRVVFLCALESICKEEVDFIDPNEVPALVTLAVNEITITGDVIPDYQKPASGILVALGQRFCHEVMEGLLLKFQPGVVPQFFLVQTMATLASVNVFGIVPFLKAILGTMLPMMGMLKYDNMKWIFSYAFAKFSEAISDYLVNIDSAPDKSVKREFFCTEIDVAYDILFSVWLNSREPKVRQSVLEAIGQMSYLMSTQKLMEDVPKLIPGLLSLYRRHSEPYHITLCMAMVLDAVGKMNPEALDSTLDVLLNTLFSQVSAAPDYSQPMTVKNHCEVLRCFDILVCSHSDRVVCFIVQRLESGNEKMRTGALYILKHLVNSSAANLNLHIQTIVTTLHSLLTDGNNKVKQVLVQIVVALAHHGHLDQPEGKDFMEFIVKQCCLGDSVPSHGKRSAAGDAEVSNESVRHICESALHLLSMAGGKAEKMLWPHLLEYVMVAEYTPAAPAILKSLGHLAAKRQEEGGDMLFRMDFQFVNIKSNEALFARLLVLLGNPVVSSRGVHVLTFLKHFAPNIGKQLCYLWDQKVPKLIQILEDSSNNLEILKWQSQVLNFLGETLTELDQQSWNAALSAAILDQISLYDDWPEDRAFMMKCLAYIACKSDEKQFAKQLVDSIVHSVRHSNSVEQEACAVAMGMCAGVHLDIVLARLEATAKSDLSKKSSGILGFMKDSKADAEQDRVRIFLMLCYSHVASDSPSMEFIAHVDFILSGFIIPQLQIAKNNLSQLQLREAAVRATRSIADSVHTEKATVVLQRRDDLLKYVTSFLEVGNESHMYCLLLDTLTSLLKLPPKQSEEERIRTMKLCLDVVFPLLNESEQESARRKNVLDSFNGLLQEMVFQAGDPRVLNDFVVAAAYWMRCDVSQHRELAVASMQCALECFQYSAQFGIGTPDTFKQSCVLLALLVPRCTDPHLPVRGVAVYCVWLVLKIAARYDGHSVDHEDLLVDSLLQVQAEINVESPQALFQVTESIAKVLSGKVPQYQLMAFLQCLLEGLLDPHTLSSNGTLVVLNYLLKHRGADLHQHVPEIIAFLHQKAQVISCLKTKVGTVRSVRNLASHHLKAVVSTLLNYPLPFDEFVTGCWRVLAEDKTLSRSIVDHFVDLINHTPPYEEQRDSYNKCVAKVVVLLPFSALSAMKEMFLRAEMEELSKFEFPKLFCVFLLALGSYVGASPPIYNPQQGDRKGDSKFSFVPNRGAYKINPVRVVLEGFKAFLMCAKFEAVAEGLVHCRQVEVNEDMSCFVDAVSLLARNVCSSATYVLPKLVPALGQALGSSVEAHRIAAAAFYSELIRVQCNGDYTLTESILNSLIACLADGSPTVRRLSIRGLGYVGELGKEQVERCSKTVLSAMLNGLGDREDPGFLVTVEAMVGLSRILSLVERPTVQEIAVNVSLRIKPYQEKEYDGVRAATFRLFGDLALFGWGGCGGEPSEGFVEQVHGNMVPLLLHLNDQSPQVVKACKHSLRQIGVLIEAKQTNAMLQRHLIDEAQLNYAGFITSLAKIMVVELADKISLYIRSSIQYFKSSQPIMKGNAAVLIGLLYGNVNEDDRIDIDLQQVCTGLALLLKDPSKEVRVKAAEATSFLFG